MTPRVVQVTSGRFHQFDLARQLEQRGLLQAIHTGYPRWKLRHEGLPPPKIRPCPWLQVPFRAGLGRWLQWAGLDEIYQHWDRKMIDRHAALTLGGIPDVLIAMSGLGSTCGQRVQCMGGKWICVRGSTHIRHQEDVLRQEYPKWGLRYRSLPQAVVAREEFEYATADRIAVPSHQVRDTFVEKGFLAERMAVIPYGVDPTRFYPAGQPAREEFQVVFAGALSVRKGLGYLLEAFRRFRHPRKRLVLAGTSTGPETRRLLTSLPAEVELRGHCSQPELREIMSRSHVFVLCSVEEGLANVMGQALACACPVIATRATGAEDLFEHRREGFILPLAEAETLAAYFEQLAGDRALRSRMSAAALERVQHLGGWRQYGDKMEALIRSLVGGGNG